MYFIYKTYLLCNSNIYILIVCENNNSIKFISCPDATSLTCICLNPYTFSNGNGILCKIFLNI